MMSAAPRERQLANVMRTIFWIVLLIVILGGCAQHYTQEAASDPYGFFSGIWHGIIFPLAVFVNIVSWMLSLFGASFLDSIQIIGRPSTGFFYYAGFAIGFFSSAGAAGN